MTEELDFAINPGSNKRGGVLLCGEEILSRYCPSLPESIVSTVIRPPRDVCGFARRAASKKNAA